MKCRITITISLLFLTFISIGTGQTLDEIKSCVTFIYLPDSKGDLVPNGTGFFVGVEDTTRHFNFVYIVTAKHVLYDTASKSFFPNAYLRLNKIKGDAGFVLVPLRTTGTTKTVFVHSDTTVDLVVIGQVPDPEKYRFQVLPYQIIRKGEDLKQLGLQEGTDVLFPALFLPHIGEHQNYPIVRFGKLALVSGGERIKWDNEMQQLHLIESISIGGHSGAPVFLWFEPRTRPGEVLTTDYTEKRIRLLGVMQGYFRNWNPIGFAKTGYTALSEAHTGISAVVPADFIFDILFGPEAVEIRNKQ